MCRYIEQSCKYTGCKNEPKHIVKSYDVSECDKAKANGTYCPTISPAKDQTGGEVAFGSSKRRGMCRECLPDLGQCNGISVLHQEPRS
jgi:hypothetical protein